MAISNVNIKLGNGALGRSSASSDGVAGLILTGKAVTGKLDLNKAYLVTSTRDLTTLGIEAETNPLAYKELTAFFTQAGDGAELYVVIVPEATLLADMVAVDDAAPIHKLIAAGGGRIRLVGINKIAPSGYTMDTDNELDKDVVDAIAAGQSVAESYFDKVRPFRMLVPAYGWTGETSVGAFAPREASYNRVGVVLAADAKIGEVYSPAVAQVLGRAASISVHQSIARVKEGAIAVSGFLADGSNPDDVLGKWEFLDDAGFIFYRTYAGKNGMYLNGDSMAAPLSDDYSSLRYGRTIDKAALLAYQVYIEEIQDNVQVDENGQIPVASCRYYEALLDNAVLTNMDGEISSFETYVNPAQNILSTETMQVTASLVPQGIARIINVELGFSNPALNQD